MCQKGWVDQTGGDLARDSASQQLRWHVTRRSEQKYYIPIDPYRGDFRLSVRVKPTYWANNCSLDFGLVESVSPANGLIVRLGAWSGGPEPWPMCFVMHNAWHNDDPSTYAHYEMGQWNRVVFTATGGTFTIDVYNDAGARVGRMSGALAARTDSPTFRYLLLGNLDTGDWPTGDGLLDDLVVERLP